MSLRMRAGAQLVAATIACSLASAQGVAMPGTAGGDPVREKMLYPSVVATLIGPFVVRGGAPEETLVLVDGFEIPRAHHTLGLRSAIPHAATSLSTTPDVSRSGPSALEMATGMAHRRARVFELTPLDFSGAARWSPSFAAATRISLYVPDAVSPLVLPEQFLDSQLRMQVAPAPRWRAFASGIYSSQVGERAHDHVARVTVGVEHRGERATTRAAVSGLADEVQRERGVHAMDVSRFSIDTRLHTTLRADELAGLTGVAWTIGEQSSYTRHDIDVRWPLLPRDGQPIAQHADPGDHSLDHHGRFWIADIAAFTSLAANLSSRIRGVVGVRVDRWGRGGGTSTQPRGELDLALTKTTRLQLDGAAYRRAPRRLDEVIQDGLNPERITQLDARLQHGGGDHWRGFATSATVFSQQRTRMIIRDGSGVLRNSGIGTAYGIEARAAAYRGPWLVGAIASLSRSLRRDHLRAAERPSQFDQPLRAHAFAGYRRSQWAVGGRASAVSGLPATSIQEAIYQADRDVYTPIFSARVYDERLPMRYELAVRAERMFAVGRDHYGAFLDVQLGSGPVDYRYSVDYKQRVPVTVPILPFVGLRALM
jgi:hypothetical protein